MSSWKPHSFPHYLNRGPAFHVPAKTAMFTTQTSLCAVLAAYMDTYLGIWILSPALFTFPPSSALFGFVSPLADSRMMRVSSLVTHHCPLARQRSLHGHMLGPR